MARYIVKTRLKKSCLADALGKKNGVQVTFINKANGEEAFTLTVGKMTPKPGQPDVCFVEADVEKAELHGTVKIPFTTRTIPFMVSKIPNPHHPRRISLEVNEKGESYIHM